MKTLIGVVILAVLIVTVTSRIPRYQNKQLDEGGTFLFFFHYCIRNLYKVLCSFIVKKHSIFLIFHLPCFLFHSCFFTILHEISWLEK